MNDGEKCEFVASKVAIGTSVTWKHSVDRRRQLLFFFLLIIKSYTNMADQLPSNQHRLNDRIKFNSINKNQR